MILLLSRTAKKLMINRLKRWIDISKVIIISFPNALAPRGFRFFLPLNYTFFTNCPRNFMRIQPESELSIFKTLRFKLYGIKHILKRLKTYNFTWVSLEKMLGYLNFNWIAFTIFIYKWCGWLIVRIFWVMEFPRFSRGTDPPNFSTVVGVVKKIVLTTKWLEHSRFLSYFFLILFTIYYYNGGIRRF